MPSPDTTPAQVSSQQKCTLAEIVRSSNRKDTAAKEWRQWLLAPVLPENSRNPTGTGLLRADTQPFQPRLGAAVVKIDDGHRVWD